MNEEDVMNDDWAINNDGYFCSFYYRALKRLLDIDSKDNVSNLSRFAKIFNEYYDFFCNLKLDLENQDEATIKLLKESLYYRFLYVYRNAALLSSAVAFHYRNVYLQHPKIIKRLIKKKQVKICSVAGCSASDIVAIITVLKSIAVKSDVELDIQVTIIDASADWKITYLTILSGFEEFHKAPWKINFIPTNLAKTSAWTSEALQAIQEADVVTIVNYTSEFNSKWNVVKMICKELKTQAMLFILDRPFKKLMEQYVGIADLGQFYLIHAELCDYHTLGIEAVKHFQNWYSKSFGGEKHLWSNIAFNVFVCVLMRALSESDTVRKNYLDRIAQNSAENYSPKQSILFNIVEQYNPRQIFLWKNADKYNRRQSFLRNNAEKYNPKQNFMCSNALVKWKNLFTKKKGADGWNTKIIKKFTQMETEKRNNMFKKSIHQKKGMISLENHLLTNVQTKETDDKQFSETNEDSSLYDYLILKSCYSLVKKNAYFTSLELNNLLYVSE